MRDINETNVSPEQKTDIEYEEVIEDNETNVSPEQKTNIEYEDVKEDTGEKSPPPAIVGGFRFLTITRPCFLPVSSFKSKTPV